MLNTYCSKLIAQSGKEKSFYISAVLALQKSSFTDKKFSNLPYNGIAPALKIMGLYCTQNSENQITVLYAKLKAQNNLNTAVSVKQSLMCIDYHYLKNFSKDENAVFKFKAGGTLLYTNTSRQFADFININQSFETILCAGPAFKIIYEPTLSNGSFQISNKLALPLVYCFAQPQYAANGKPSVTHFFKESKLSFFSSCIQLQNTFWAGKKFAGRSSIGLEYTWNYYKLNTVRQVQYLSHQLGILYQQKL